MRVSERARRKTPKAAALEEEGDQHLFMKPAKEEDRVLSESHYVDEPRFESDSLDKKFEVDEEDEKMALSEAEEERSNNETSDKNEEYEVKEVKSETVMSFDIKLFEQPQVIINRLARYEVQTNQPINHDASEISRKVEDVRAKLDLPPCIQLSINRNNAAASNKIAKIPESRGAFGRIRKQPMTMASQPKRKPSVRHSDEALQIFYKSVKLSKKLQKINESRAAREIAPDVVEFVDSAQVEVDQNEPNSTEKSEQQLEIKACRLDQVERKSLGCIEEAAENEMTVMETNESERRMKVPNVANLFEAAENEMTVMETNESETRMKEPIIANLFVAAEEEIKETGNPSVRSDQNTKNESVKSNQQTKVVEEKQSKAKKTPKPRKRKYGMLEEQVKEKLRQAFIKSQPYNEDDIAGCSVCKVKFLSSAIRDHHKCPGKCDHERYQCNLCLSYVNPKRFIYHMDSHRQKLDLSGSVTCPICQLVIKDKRLLNDHFQQNHNRYEEGVCVVCTKVMPIEELRVHVRKHHYENQVMCPVCGACFRFPCLLKLHLSKHDSTQTSLVCEHCGKVYINSERLHVHIKTTHSKLQFPCEHCGKVFKTAAMLVRHARVHMREKAFSCPLCDYGASRKDTVRSHSKRVHNYDMPNHEVITNFVESGQNNEESRDLPIDSNVKEENDTTTVVVIDSAANDGVERTTEFQVHNNGHVTEAYS